MIVPVWPNPTVESTLITDEPILTLSRHLVACVISKSPRIVESESSKPIKSDNL